MPTEDRPARKWPWAVALVLLVPLATCGGTGGYAYLKVRWAHRTVHAFCDTVAVGSPIADLDARAQKMGLRTMHTTSRPPDPDLFVAWEGWIFARTFCNVGHDGKLVLSKRTSSLD